MKKKRILTGSRLGMAIAVCACLVLGAVGSLSAQTWVPVWTDIFNGPAGSYPSTNDWTYEQNGNGEGNAELEYYCPPTDNSYPCSTSQPNVYEDGNGNLVIRAVDNAGQWTSARMNTAGHHDIQYGRFEATMELPSGAGLWPAWWMLGSNIGTVGWPTCGEIDIMENIPAMGTSTIQSSLHGANGFNTGNQTTLSSSDANWHTYGVNWYPGTVQFYVDNYQTPFATLTPSSSGGTWEFDNGTFFMILNLAVGGNWPGAPDSSTPNPAYMLVNKVEVLQYCAAGITNLGCNNGTPVSGTTSSGGTGGSSSGEGPYGGTAWSLPGTVQAENFDTGGDNVAYYTTDNINHGGQYRTSEGVSIETTSDTGGGYDVGWTTAGQWMNYTVNVTASGNYVFNLRCANPGSGATVHFSVDGSNATGSMTIPDTGGWQTWTTISSGTVYLSAGQHVIQLYEEANGSNGSVGNYNWWSVSSAGGSGGSGGSISSSNWYEVINKTSGLCMDAAGWGTANGTILQQWACGSGQANQEWQFQAAATGGYDAVYNRNATSLVWDNEGSTAAGNGVWLWTYGNGNTNQEWEPVSLGNGLWNFVNLTSGMCLDNTGSTANGVGMTQWTCESGNTNQEFSLVQEP